MQEPVVIARMVNAGLLSHQRPLLIEIVQEGIVIVLVVAAHRKLKKQDNLLFQVQVGDAEMATVTNSLAIQALNKINFESG